jgi:hypothetical protein
MLAVMSEVVIEGAQCRPNIGAAGRRRRTRVAQVSAVIAIVLFVMLVAVHAGWPLRMLVALPAGVAFVSGLQVRRNTCVAHARTGVIENEDLTTTKVEEAFATASRRVAATIWRDSVIGMALVAALAAASALVS